MLTVNNLEKRYYPNRHTPHAIAHVPSVTKLANCFLSKGFVPTGFKMAVVTQLIKKITTT